MTPTRPLRAALVALAGLAVYANTLRGGFVLDDKPIIVENQLIRSLSRAPRLFAENYWNAGNAPGPAHGGLYRPLPLLTYALNYAAGGLKPAGYHAANLALHACVSVLVMLLALALGAAENAALFSGLAFAVLPVHSEAVASIVGRAELLSALGVLSAWLLAFRSESKTRLVAALVFFAGALLCKESAAAFPLAFALSEGSARRRWPVWSLFAVVLALYLEWRRALLGGAFATGGGAYFAGKSPAVILPTMGRFAAAHYLLPTLTGVGLCADFSRPQIPDSSPGDALGWALAAGFLLCAAWEILRRRRSPISLGFVLLLPVSNLLFKIDVIGAERFLYLPSAGFCLMAPRRAALGAVLLAWWAFATVQRNLVWRSEETLWEATLRAAPDSPRALNGLGAVRDSQGRRAEARSLFSRAIALDPSLSSAMYNMGKSFFNEGELGTAREWTIKAARRAPWDKDALCLLGLIAEKQGNPSAAASYYRDALRLNPLYAAARRNLGLLYFRTGRPDLGREQLALYLRDASPEEAADVREFLRQ